MTAASVGQDPYGGGGQRPASRAERALQLSDPPDQERGHDDEEDFDDDGGRSELGNENFKARPMPYPTPRLLL